MEAVLNCSFLGMSKEVLEVEFEVELPGGHGLRVVPVRVAQSYSELNQLQIVHVLTHNLIL